MARMEFKIEEVQLHPEGEFDAIIEKVTEKVSAAGNQTVNLQLITPHGKLFLNYVTTGAGQVYFIKFLKDMNILTVQDDGTVSIDMDSLIGKHINVAATKEIYEGVERIRTTFLS